MSKLEIIKIETKNRLIHSVKETCHKSSQLNLFLPLPQFFMGAVTSENYFKICAQFKRFCNVKLYQVKQILLKEQSVFQSIGGKLF